MQPRNIVYAQSGGPTSVINATALAVIETARKYPDKIGTVFAGANGILGVLNNELIDTSKEPISNLQALQFTPGSAFGSCRHRLKDINEDDSDYIRLIDVFKANNVGYFFYNGGGDSQDTAHKVSQLSKKMNYPLTCIGLPKTIDNDLAHTDNCPGFGSAAKYIATSILEASLDLVSMARSSTKIFIMEVMGRHTGWLAASAGLAQKSIGQPPHLILFPEVPFDQACFLSKVDDTVKRHGHCVIVASEGIRDDQGKFISQSGMADAFGHQQLGGVGPILGNLINETLGYKQHVAVADYLQRCARHIASHTDHEQAYAIGQAAVEKALNGENNVMLTIVREGTPAYQWHIGTVPLHKVANVEKKLPKRFIRKDGFGISQACRDYLQPLIEGEAYPIYKDGLPQYIRLENNRVTQSKQVNEKIK